MVTCVVMRGVTRWSYGNLLHHGPFMFVEFGNVGTCSKNSRMDFDRGKSVSTRNRIWRWSLTYSIKLKEAIRKAFEIWLKLSHVRGYLRTLQIFKIYKHVIVYFLWDLPGFELFIIEYHALRSLALKDILILF